MMATVFEQGINRPQYPAGVGQPASLGDTIRIHVSSISSSSNYPQQRIYPSGNTGISTSLSKPKHQQYETLEARLNSFVGWPAQYVPKTPEELAATGFFYIGSADRVTCFQCGITLRDWEEEHDPATEHRRYSENCQFINTPDLDQLGVATRPGLRTPSSDLETDSEEVFDSLSGDLEVDGPHSSYDESNLEASAALDTPRNVLYVDDGHLVPTTASSSVPDTDTSASLDDDLEVDSGDPIPSDHSVTGDICTKDQKGGDDAVANLKDMGFSENEVRTALVRFENKYGRKHRDTSELVEFIFDEEIVPKHRNDEQKKDVNTLKRTNLQNNEKKTTRNTSPRSPGSPKKSVIDPLKAENQRLKEQKRCKRCRNKDVGILFLPCGHLVTCETCADKFVNCVLCGKDILGTVKTYLT